VSFPVELLRTLIRFDTSNPPGNEGACVAYLRDLLERAGLATQLFALDPDRPNLLARLPGRGLAPPLLLHGHVDVVPTAGQRWTHPPFAADVADGFIWGRGALDMKAGVAMMVAAVLEAAAGPEAPAGDVLLAVLSDEERGGRYGARYLVETHPQLFAGVRHAIGELGGFSHYLGRRKLYPVQVAEKQVCRLRVIVRGPAGHGAVPARGGAMARLGALLLRLDGHPLPLHVTPVARLMFGAVGAALPLPQRVALEALGRPPLAGAALRLLGAQGESFRPLLHHTVTPTSVRGGEGPNVVPGEVTVELDGRLLPGFTPDDLLAELRPLAGPGADVEVTGYEPGPPAPDLTLFPTLAAVLREGDPSGTAVPFLSPGASDARLFARLGIQTYGFLPMDLPRGFRYAQAIHGPDERIPVEAVAFGAGALRALLRRYRSTT
jgi:acetylornithine deacetylase/succinyl-diaminopimelate desuccinylase-like protein